MFEKFDSIADSRKELLDSIAEFIVKNEIKDVNFICTHNSRRSQMCEVWGREATVFYGLSDKLSFYSGGMETTEFNPNAVEAITSFGVKLEKGEGKNPIYEHHIGSNVSKCFSKLYDDEYNPKENFIAVMTCSDADENCPNVMGAKAKFSLTFEDPKVFDNTENVKKGYKDRCEEIATQVFYLISRLK